MADKELRRMNRTELIEIIYALQQNEQQLDKQIEEMSRQLEDRRVRIENSGSIAEAALSLNHIFEDAQAAAELYLESIRETPEHDNDAVAEVNEQPQDIIAQARHEADEILESARVKARHEADEILESARVKAGQEAEKIEQQRKELIGACEEIDKARKELDEERKELDKERKRCELEKNAVIEFRDNFISEARDFLNQNPELAVKMYKNN